MFSLVNRLIRDPDNCRYRFGRHKHEAVAHGKTYPALRIQVGQQRLLQSYRQISVAGTESPCSVICVLSAKDLPFCHIADSLHSRAANAVHSKCFSGA